MLTTRLTFAAAPVLVACALIACSETTSTHTSIRIAGLENAWQLTVLDGLRLGGSDGLVLAGVADLRSNGPIEVEVEDLLVAVGPDEVLVDGRSYGPVAEGQEVAIGRDGVRVDGELRGPFPPED